MKVTQRVKTEKEQKPPHAERATYHVDATKEQVHQLELFEIDHPLACIHRLQFLCQVRLRPRNPEFPQHPFRDSASELSCQNVANRQGSQMTCAVESRADHRACSILHLLSRHQQRTDGHPQMRTQLSRSGTRQQRTNIRKRNSKSLTRWPLSTNQSANKGKQLECTVNLILEDAPTHPHRHGRG